MKFDLIHFKLFQGGIRLDRPVIPETEFLERQEKVRRKMKEEGFDLLILYADDGAVFGQEHARWLFNYQPHFEPACILVPVEGEPVLLTGVESEEYIYASSYCKNVKVVDEFVYEAHEFPFSEIVSLDDQIKEIIHGVGRELKKVGVVGSNRITNRLFTRLATIINKDIMIPADQLMYELRSVKSENEIKVLEYAYYIAQKGTEAAIEAISVGKTEREVAAEAEYVMRKLGAEGFGIDTFVASGKKHNYPIIARTTFKEIQNNELILLTIAPRYEGYHGAIGRPVVVGNVSQEIENAIKVAMEAQNAAKEMLKPGIAGNEADDAARRVVEEAGLLKHYVYTGIHSIGVSEFEPPSLNNLYTKPLQEDMVFSIDIPLFFNSWGGFRYEDGFHITKDGARPLQTLPTEMIKI